MTGFPKSVREKAVKRSGGLCERCGLSEWTELHHRRARGMGGAKRPTTNLIPNALGLCLLCHRYVESYRKDALNRGWLVSQYADPASTPLLYRGRWAYLHPDGRVRFCYERLGEGPSKVP